MVISDLTGLGVVNQAFSISLWIRPYSLSGTLVFVTSSIVSVSWCTPFIGFSSSGAIAAQVYAGSVQSVIGPTNLTLSVWHQIVQTWSSTNGLRLYVDNVLVASNASVVTYSASSLSNYVELANRPNWGCVTGPISGYAFYGDIDDFGVYSRELTANDVCALYYN